MAMVAIRDSGRPRAAAFAAYRMLKRADSS
jgi:hypothetical protein